MKKREEQVASQIKIYLDDDVDRNSLINVLNSIGFIVMSPRQVGMSKKKDHQHLAYASLQKAVILTRNFRDFKELHKKHKHSGIFLIYRYNNPKKDMNNTQIAKAIKNLLDTGISIENNILVLNQYNY